MPNNNWLQQWLANCGNPPPPPGLQWLDCVCAYTSVWDCDDTWTPTMPGQGKTVSWRFAKALTPAEEAIAITLPMNRWFKDTTMPIPSKNNDWRCNLIYYKRVARLVPLGTTCGPNFPAPRLPVQANLGDWPGPITKTDGTQIVDIPYPTGFPEAGKGGQARAAGCVCPRKYVFTPCVDCKGKTDYSRRGNRQRVERKLYLTSDLDLLGANSWVIIAYKDRTKWGCYIVRLATAAEAAMQEPEPMRFWYTFDRAKARQGNQPGGWRYNNSGDGPCFTSNCMTCMDGWTFRVWNCEEMQRRGGPATLHGQPEAVRRHWSNVLGVVKYFYVPPTEANYNWYNAHATQGGRCDFVPITYKIHQQRAPGDQRLNPSLIGTCWHLEWVPCPEKWELAARSLTTNMSSLVRPAGVGPNTQPGEILGPYKQDYVDCADCLKPPPPEPPVKPPPPKPVNKCGYPVAILHDMCSTNGTMSGTGHLGGKYYGKSVVGLGTASNLKKRGGLPYWVESGDTLKLIVTIKMGRYNTEKDCKGNVSKKVYYQWRYRSNRHRRWQWGEIKETTAGRFTERPTRKDVILEGQFYPEPPSRAFGTRLNKASLYDGTYQLVLWSPKDGMTGWRNGRWNSTKHHPKVYSCMFNVVLRDAAARRRPRGYGDAKVVWIDFSVRAGKRVPRGKSGTFRCWALLSDIQTMKQEWRHDNSSFCGSFGYEWKDRMSEGACEGEPTRLYGKPNMRDGKVWIPGFLIETIRMSLITTGRIDWVDRFCWNVKWYYSEGMTYNNTILGTRHNAVEPVPISFMNQVTNSAGIYSTSCTKCASDLSEDATC